MTHEDKKEFKEFLVQAQQSGKRESSGLVADMQKTVLILSEGLERNNKQIEKNTVLIEEMKQAIHDIRIEQSLHTQGAREFMKKVDPIVVWFDGLTFTNKATMWVLKIIGAIGVAAFTIKQLDLWK